MWKHKLTCLYLIQHKSTKYLMLLLILPAEYYVDALWNQSKRTDLICPLFDEEINECVDNYSCSDENVGFSNYDCWRKQFIKDAINYIYGQNKEN